MSINTISYTKATKLLKEACSKNGFLATAQTHETYSNYNRVWARDGVICGLAALLDGEASLVTTFKKTLITLASNQHELGHIPSNVLCLDSGVNKVSFGGLAGRVDTISWFVIGVCNYYWFTKDEAFIKQMIPQINKGLNLLNAWEFNNRDLLYIPRSGNWADEYITEGHTLYDQVLRLWALRCYQKVVPSAETKKKIIKITDIVEYNFKDGDSKNTYHPKAYNNLEQSNYWMASVNPSGYQTMYDAFGNAIALLLQLGTTNFQKKIIAFSEQLRDQLKLKLLPAFWPAIKEGDPEWNLLLNNCKYEFRNYPNEFHNGGTWQMVNGFYALGIMPFSNKIATQLLTQIEEINKIEDFSFYENFNTKTGLPIGVKYCTWSAASQILITQYLNGKKLLN